MTYLLFSVLVALGMTIGEIDWKKPSFLEILVSFIVLFPLHFAIWPILMGATFVKIKRNLK
jgi:hypothetical protein